MRSCRRIADARANAHACDQPYYAPPLPRRQVLGKRAHLATRASAPQAAASLKASPAEELAAITNEARERLAALGLGMNTSDKPGLSMPPADAGAAREGARQGGHASESGIGVTGSAASGGVLTKTAGSVGAAGKGGGAHNIVSHSDLQARRPPQSWRCSGSRGGSRGRAVAATPRALR